MMFAMLFFKNDFFLNTFDTFDIFHDKLILKYFKQFSLV